MFKLTDLDGKGRALVAKEDLSPGAEILREKASVYVISKETRSRVCHSCFDFHRNLRKCSRCKYTYYCSLDCQRKDWHDHRVECRCLERILPKHPVDFCMLVTRVLLKFFHRVESTNGSYLRGLVSHFGEGDDAKVEKLKCFLQVTKDILGTKLFEEIVLTECEIVDLMCALICNTFSLTNDSFEEIGCGIFPTAWAFNHSCGPNVLPVFVGNEVAFRTLMNVKCNEELTITYIDNMAVSRNRQKALRESYSFSCECLRCIQCAQEDLLMEGGKCIATDRCNGIVDLSNNVCIECKEKNEYKIGLHPHYFMDQIGKLLHCVKNNNKNTYPDLETRVVESQQYLHTFNLQLIKGFDQLVENCLQESKWKEAVTFGKKALLGLQRYYTQFHPCIGLLLCKIGKCQALLGDLSEAIEFLSQGRKVLAVGYGERNATVSEITDYIVQLMAESRSQ